ncbi:MAG: ABC transporter substrate-binding protein [Boseongicola sp.]|nr:MAG: ABC transporter substrate-binding protein [Boseongicola sp.]
MSLKSNLLATSIATLVGSTAFAGGHLTEVSFGTNWIAQAEHGGYYQAVADGTYEACGLSVTVVPGGPQVNNRAQMLAGKIEFHMGGNLLQAFSAAKEGIPMKVVAAHFQKEPQVLLSHPGKVSSFEDLKNLETLIIGDNGFQSFYQWMMADYGFSAENRVPYTFNPAPFLANENSAQQGYITSEPFAIENEGGFAPDIWLLADSGFTTYATTVETMQATIDSNPDAVRCFVEGSAVGWANYLYGDPSAANALIKADNADMSDAQIAFSIDKMKEYGIVDSGDALELGIGAMKAETIQGFYDKMVAVGVTEAGLDIESIYSLEFANTGAGLAAKEKASMAQ